MEVNLAIIGIQEFLNEFSESIKINPDNPNYRRIKEKILNGLDIYTRASNKIESSLEELEESFKLNLDNPEYHRNKKFPLNMLYSHKGKELVNRPVIDWINIFDPNANEKKQNIEKIFYKGLSDILNNAEINRKRKDGYILIGIGGKLYFNNYKYTFKTGFSHEYKLWGDSLYKSKSLDIFLSLRK